MPYQPQFTATAALVASLERIAALREKIAAATIEVPWIPALQRDAAARTAHCSTAIEGNPLTLAQVRALAEGRELPSVADRAKREVLNYFAGLRFVQQHAAGARITHGEILQLHAIIAAGAMDQGAAGRYRSLAVRVGHYIPPAPELVSGLMGEMLAWWNGDAAKWSPVISAAVIHHQFESIHPFADGNGRTGRALALWELYRRGFDTHHIFSVDECYWNDRPRYYDELDRVRRQGDDLTSWLEYSAEVLHHTLEKVWTRIQQLAAATPKGRKLALTPRQERLLHLLRDTGAMTPRDIWDALGVSRQGAALLMKPLLDAGIIRKTGSKKTGKYGLRKT